MIPPDEVIQLAVDINKTLPETAADDYLLDARTCIPHITLLPGLIAREQLSEVVSKLGVLAEQFSALNLKITHIKTSARPDGKAIAGLEIEKTPALQKLHQAILDATSTLFTYNNVQKEMFYSPPPVNEIPLFWLRGFAKNNVRENYKPHITLGMGEPKPIAAPIQFRASTLALGHLGNYGTCRKIFWSVSLV